MVVIILQNKLCVSLRTFAPSAVNRLFAHIYRRGRRGYADIHREISQRSRWFAAVACVAGFQRGHLESPTQPSQETGARST